MNGGGAHEIPIVNSQKLHCWATVRGYMQYITGRTRFRGGGYIIYYIYSFGRQLTCFFTPQGGLDSRYPRDMLPVESNPMFERY